MNSHGELLACSITARDCVVISNSSNERDLRKSLRCELLSFRLVVGRYLIFLVRKLPDPFPMRPMKAGTALGNIVVMDDDDDSIYSGAMEYMYICARSK